MPVAAVSGARKIFSPMNMADFAALAAGGFFSLRVLRHDTIRIGVFTEAPTTSWRGLDFETRLSPDGTKIFTGYVA